VAESSIKKAVFDAKLHRDQLSHGRPGSDVDIYTGLLEDVAAKYAEAPKDKDGGFSVSAEDSIEFEMMVGGSLQKGKVTVTDLLSRAGMVFLDPADTLNYHYTFAPFWLQRYLVQRYNAHIASTHSSGELESCGP
jgi:hypothetical protein